MEVQQAKNKDYCEHLQSHGPKAPLKAFGASRAKNRAHSLFPRESFGWASPGHSLGIGCPSGTPDTAIACGKRAEGPHTVTQGKDSPFFLFPPAVSLLSSSLPTNGEAVLLLCLRPRGPHSGLLPVRNGAWGAPINLNDRLHQVLRWATVFLQRMAFSS
jgi:hypothetical protein